MEIKYSGVALEQLQALDVSIRKRILDKMRFYRSQEKPLTFAKRLVGHDAYRFRVGAYRIICDVESNMLRVLAVAKRDDAYRDL